jgi:hypothetical protein
MIEVWKTIKDYPNYECSSHGRIRRCTAARSTRVGSILKTSLNNKGYPVWATRTVEGKFKLLLVHRIVCKTFHGEAPTEKHQVAHSDGSRTNNHISNLRWATASENNKDKELHGRVNRGVKNGNNQLSDFSVRVIKRLSGCVSARAMGLIFGVSHTTISSINTGKTWSHV